ncbi:hypothetical protein PAXRUDRAFT_653241 [Paxillus rubicundulus Ve08.2h10]|uniref:Uncharacterized protein n=1 Tax=Paxillus rubicundulus Ve08.2h10 TaxID=930991 RepID=A0A0D0E8N7_9AGAM|nr:hypothetical protein PAXRUDRAFT_653241 [Paxillus rubicundulus Ve08.2h10]
MSDQCKSISESSQRDRSQVVSCVLELYTMPCASYRGSKKRQAWDSNPESLAYTTGN